MSLLYINSLNVLFGGPTCIWVSISGDLTLNYICFDRNDLLIDCKKYFVHYWHIERYTNKE